MNLSIHPEANKEGRRAARHYSGIYPELGKSFRAEIEAAIQRILQSPQAWHPMKNNFRRCSLNNFPFGIIYRVNETENTCQVFAVMHFKRKPGYWKNRRF